MEFIWDTAAAVSSLTGGATTTGGAGATGLEPSAARKVGSWENTAGTARARSGTRMKRGRFMRGFFGSLSDSTERRIRRSISEVVANGNRESVLLVALL